MRLDLLILIRLATIKSLARGDLAKQLRPLAAVDDFKKLLDERLRVLAGGGWINVRPLRITDLGRDRAAEALGMDVMPTWRQVKARHLPALALGIAATSAADLRDAIVAQLLVRYLGLSPRSADPHQIIKMAVASVMKVPRADAPALRVALMRRWTLEEEVVPPVRTPPPVVALSKPVDPAPPKPWSDDDVVAAVRSATAHVPAAGRFGGDRVFVSAIWRQLDEGAGFPGLTLDGLKARLIAANRRQQLTLARADLVGAMDPREVAASEIRHLNSTYHFVLDRSRP